MSGILSKIIKNLTVKIDFVHLTNRPTNLIESSLKAVPWLIYPKTCQQLQKNIYIFFML